MRRICPIHRSMQKTRRTRYLYGNTVSVSNIYFGCYAVLMNGRFANVHIAARLEKNLVPARVAVR